ESFVSTEAAHSTAAFLSVKLFLKIFRFFSTACASDQILFSSAGGEFYSVQNRCQPPLSTAFDQNRPKH
ncbi:hypothetical protein ACF8C6_12245, partial [Pseudomonas sp. zbq_18]